MVDKIPYLSNESEEEGGGAAHLVNDITKKQKKITRVNNRESPINRIHGNFIFTGDSCCSQTWKTRTG